MTSRIMSAAEIPNRYAMRVAGNCLAPSVKDGMELAFAQDKPLVLGGLVVIWLRPDGLKDDEPQALVKILEIAPPSWWNSQRPVLCENFEPAIMVRMLHPAKTFDVGLNSVMAIHRCTTKVELDEGPVMIPWLTHEQLIARHERDQRGRAA